MLVQEFGDFRVSLSKNAVDAEVEVGLVQLKKARAAFPSLLFKAGRGGVILVALHRWHVKNPILIMGCRAEMFAFFVKQCTQRTAKIGCV